MQISQCQNTHDTTELIKCSASLNSDNSGEYLTHQLADSLVIFEGGSLSIKARITSTIKVKTCNLQAATYKRSLSQLWIKPARDLHSLADFIGIILHMHNNICIIMPMKSTRLVQVLPDILQVSLLCDRVGREARLQRQFPELDCLGIGVATVAISEV